MTNCSKFKPNQLNIYKLETIVPIKVIMEIKKRAEALSLFINHRVTIKQYFHLGTTLRYLERFV